MVVSVVQEGKRLQDLSRLKLESHITILLLHSGGQSKSEAQSSFKGWQSHFVKGVHPVIEGVIIPVSGQTV